MRFACYNSKMAGIRPRGPMIQKTATICSFTSILNQCTYQCVGALATCSCVGTHTHTHAHNTSTVCLCSARADLNCCSYHRQLFCVCLLPHCGLLAGSSPFRGCRGVSETIVTKSRHYRTHTCHSLRRGGQGCSQDIFSTEAKI